SGAITLCSQTTTSSDYWLFCAGYADRRACADAHAGGPDGVRPTGRLRRDGGGRWAWRRDRDGSGGDELAAPFGPLEGVPDGVLDAVLRLPAEQVPGLGRVDEGADDVAGPRGGLLDLETVPDDLAEGGDQLTDGGAVAGPEVDHLVAGAAPQRRDDRVEAQGRLVERAGDVPDVDVVADRRAVAGRPVHPRDREGDAALVALDHLAEGVGGLAALQPGAQLRVRADRVEVAQRDHPQPGGV